MAFEMFSRLIGLSQTDSRYALLVSMRKVLVVLMLLFGSVSAFAEPEVSANEDDLLVVQLAVQDYVGQETLFVYHSPDVTLVPVADIAHFLEVAVDVDVGSKLIRGWVGDESNDVELNLIDKVFYQSGRQQPWDAQTRYAESDGILYLDLQTAQTLFSVEFNLDVSQLQLLIEGDEATSPILAKLARQKRQARLRPLTRRESFPEHYLPNEYDWYSVPQFDFSVGGDIEHNRGELSRRHNVLLQGRADLVKHSLHTSYIDNDGDEDLRLTFSRASEGPDKTIALGMDYYEVGDIYGVSDSLTFSSTPGRGVRLSRGGQDVQERGDSVTLQGDAPPNWEVELYRNGHLIQFAETSDDGRYLFEDIPVFVGENIFEVRLYGPQGQSRVVQEIVSAGGAMLSEGAWEYDIWALRRNKHLIDSSINSNDPETDFYMAEARYGINSFWSARIGASQMTPDNNVVEHKYLFGSVYGSLFGVLAQLHYSNNNQGGAAYQGDLQTRLLDTNINIDNTYYDQFISDRNTSGRLEHDNGIRLNRSFLVGLPSPLSVDLELRRQSYNDGAKNIRTTLQKRTGWGGYQFANNLTYSNNSSSSYDEEVYGAAGATRRWEEWRYRAGINYRVVPTSRVSGIVFGGSRRFGKNMNYSGTVSYNIEGKDSLTNDHTVTWDLGKFSVSGSTGFSTDGLQYVGVSLNTSLGYDSQKKEHFFSSQSTTNNASLAAQFFIDEDNDGEFDEGEQPVSGIRFKRGGQWNKYESDEQGRMSVQGLSHLSMDKIEVDERSIEDPFIRAPEGPIYVYSHAGATVEVDIPLVMTLDIEGVLRYQRDTKFVPLSGMRVSLIDEKGNLVQTVRSEYDGVYLFAAVVPGKYCIKVDESDLTKQELQPESQIQCLVASGTDGVIFVDDKLFRPQHIPHF